MVEIEIGKLSQHPKNVRRNYTDIDELADSIRANGILQNLTVVPDPAQEGHYLVVIGNRRLAAARKAGLETAPCTISDMSEAEQIQTMLAENMQRKELNPYEEARGIQLCFDLGLSEDDIAGKLGLSKKTIQKKRRILNLGLDAGMAEEKAREGATIDDYLKLAKLNDEENRNKALESIGTADFDFKLKQLEATEKAKEKAEKAKEWVEETKKKLSTFATEVMETPRYNEYKKYVVWLRPGEEIPEPSEGAEYIYHVYGDGISVYEMHSEADKEAAREKQAVANRIETNRRELDNLMHTVAELWMDFIKSKDRDPADCSKLETWAMYTMQNGMQPDAEITEKLEVLTGCEDYEDDEKVSECIMALEKFPERERRNRLQKFIFCSLYQKPRTMGYNGVYLGAEEVEPVRNFLKDLGYEAGEMETSLLDGTSALYEAKE